MVTVWEFDQYSKVLNVIMEHKTSHKGPFCEIEIYIRH